MKLENLSNTKMRLIVSSITVAILLIIITLSSFILFRPVFATILATVVGIAMWEYFRMLQAKNLQPPLKLGILCSVLYIYAAFFSSQQALPSGTLVVFLGLILLVLFLERFVFPTDAIVNISAVFFGIVYIAIPLGFILEIVYFFPSGSLQDGRWWLIYLLAVTKITDTGAFFVGHKFGRTKLAEKLSPEKTWEGAIGGLLSALVLSTIFSFSGVIDISFLQALAMGILIGVLAQVGDLAESLLKRDAGIKDSNTLPGLGGVLDMVDSLLITTPLVYLFMRINF